MASVEAAGPPVTGAALARAALAGNPSDGYGGAVLAVTIPGFEARVTVTASGSRGVEAGLELTDATLARFEREFGVSGSLAGWQTSIPRSVGLGGSSAIVIATLRALCVCHGVELEPEAMAELALSIERDDLGIAAGLQDRIAQSYGGLTFMEFAVPHGYERLDPSLLPPILIAWRSHSAEHSGVVHGNLRERFDAGEPAVRAAMRELGRLARGAREAVLAADHAGLARCADASFDVRERILDLDPLHVEMVRVARTAGAGVNYTGSGGAVICVCGDQTQLLCVETALRAVSCDTVRL